MKINKILLVCIFLLAIIAIGAVSASDDADNLTAVDGGDDLDIVETAIDDVEKDELIGDGENLDEGPVNVSYEIDSYLEVDSLESKWNDVVSYWFEDEATGTLSIFLNDTEIYHAGIKSGSWSRLSSDDLGLYYFDYGIYDIDFIYSGDENFNGFNESRTIELTYRFDAYDYLDNEGFYGLRYGNSLYFDMSYPAFRGKIVYTVNGKEREVVFDEDFDGEIRIDSSDIVYGYNNFTFTYVNDEYPLKTISKSVYCHSLISFGKRTIPFDEPLYVTVELPEDATGVLKVYEVFHNGYDEYDGYNLTLLAEGNVENGMVNVSISNLDLGAHKLWANFTGNYYDVVASGYDFDPNDPSEGMPISISPKFTIPSLVWVNGTYTAKVEFPKDCSGELVVRIENETRSFNFTNSIATFELFNLDYTEEWWWDGSYLLDMVCTFEDNSWGESFYVSYDNPRFEIKLDENYSNRTIVKNCERYYNSFMVPSGNVTVYVDDVYYGPAEIEPDMDYDYAYVRISPDNLTLGKHDVRIEYSGNDYFLPATAYDSFNLTYIDIYIPDEVTIGEYYEYLSSNFALVELPADATGEIKLVVDDKDISTEKDLNGINRIRLSNLTQGNHTVTLIYQNGNYPSFSQSNKVEARYRYLIESDEMFYDGGNSIALPIGATGEVVINVAGKQFRAPINENGIAAFNITDVPAGEYEMTVTYAGNGKYPAGSEKFNITVRYYIDSNIKHNEMILDSNLQNYTIELTLPENATGKLGFYDYDTDDEIATFDLVKGKVNVTLKELFDGIEYKTGYWDINVNYIGDDYSVKTNNIWFTVVNCQLTRNFNQDHVSLGETVNCTFESTRNITGYLKVLTGNRYKTVLYDKISIENGVATLLLDASALGTQSFRVVYVGDDLDFKDEVYFNVWPENVTLMDKATADEVVFAVKMPDDASGNLIAYLFSNSDDKSLDVNTTYKGGIATINASQIPKGNWTFDYFKIMDEKYGTFDFSSTSQYCDYGNYGEFEIADVPLGVADANLTAFAKDINVGDVAVIEIAIDKNVTGKVTVNGIKVNLTKGIAKYEIADLASGNYTYIVKFAGDNYYAADEKAVSVAVSKLPAPQIVIEAEKSVVVGLNITVKVIVAGASGIVAINGEEIQLVNGTASATFTDLAIGNAVFEVIYSGDAKYLNSSSSAIVNVYPKGDPNLVVTAKDINVGDVAVIEIAIDKNVTGKVTVDGKEIIIASGAGRYEIPDLANGTYEYTVKFAGDRYFNASEKTVNVVVSKIASEITIDVKESATVGDVFTINVSNNTDVIVTINNKTYEAKDGKIDIDTSKLPAGEYTVVIKTSENDKYLSGTATKTFKVNKVESPAGTTPFNVKDNEIVESKTPTYSIELGKDATGTLTVTIGDKNYTKELVDGKATIEVTDMPVGNYNVTISYSGDDKYAPATQTTKATVKVDPEIVAKNTNVLYTANGKYSVTVYGTDGKIAKNALVIFKINGKQVGKGYTNDNGIATYTVKNVPGTYKIVATALGASATKTLTVKHLVTLKTATLKKSAKKLTLQATLAKVNGKYLKKKTITFKINGKKVATAKTNNKGVAKITIKNPNVVKNLKAGKKATYQATYLKDTVKKTVKVKK